MNNDEVKSELILKIHRVWNKDGHWMPAVQDAVSHDIDAQWVAGLAYLIIDRYVNAIPESNQNEFHDEVMWWFNKMSTQDNTTEYIEKINIPKSMN